MATCRECHNSEAICGPLSASGECLDCELTAATARDLETLRMLEERGYEGALVHVHQVGCPECGGVDVVEENGVSMCSNCGRVR